MSHGEFKQKVMALKRRSGISGYIKFYEDLYKGKHIAMIDDVRITGNSVTNAMTIKWGSGHTSIVTM